MHCLFVLFLSFCLFCFLGVPKRFLDIIFLAGATFSYERILTIMCFAPSVSQTVNPGIVLFHKGLKGESVKGGEGKTNKLLCNESGGEYHTQSCVHVLTRIGPQTIYRVIHRG